MKRRASLRGWKSKSLAGFFNPDPCPRPLEGETSLTETDRAEFLIGLDFSEMRPLIGTERVRGEKRCRVGWYLMDVGGGRKLPRYIRPSDVRSAVAVLRAAQPRDGRRGRTIGPDNVAMSSVRIEGTFKGKQEKSLRLSIIHDGSDASPSAFRANMKRLAQDLACALAQKVVITSIDKTPTETYLHSPTSFPDPD